MTISINGEFYARPVTGIERVARETVKALDPLLKDSAAKVELVIPKNAIDVPDLKNIAIVTLPKKITFFPSWTQLTYQAYIIKNKRLSLDFTNVTPYFKPGVAYIHDIYALLYKGDYKKTARDKLVALYSRAMYKRIAKSAKAVITVSEFSKSSIIDKYKIDGARLTVIYPGCPIGDMPIDDSVLKEHSNLKAGEFYFVLGSLQKRKNLDWVIKHARLFPGETFAVSGKAISTNSVDVKELPPNIELLGYLSDAQVRVLFKSAKAFVFPSYFEGFGLPPLEALSMGCRAIVSKASCLSEVYGDAVYYIDPDVPNIDLDELLEKDVKSAQELLKKYTYENAAKKLLPILIRFSTL